MLSPGTKRPGHDADHSPVEVENAWNYTFTRPYVFKNDAESTTGLFYFSFYLPMHKL
jgi:hypothetical protein